MKLCRQIHLVWSGSVALVFFTLALPLLLVFGFYPPALRVIRRILIQFLFLCMGVRIRPGGAKLPKGPAVLVANHHSWIDVLLLIAHFSSRDLVFLGNANLTRNYFTSLFMMRTDVTIAPGKPGTYKKALRQVEDYLDRGFKVVFFPEGGIVPEWSVPFKTGAFKMARDKNVPLVPVVLEGAALLAPLALFKEGTKPGIVNLTVGSSQNPEIWEHPEQAARKTRKWMHAEAMKYADHR